jgi:hypothetical protein
MGFKGLINENQKRIPLRFRFICIAAKLLALLVVILD